MHRLSGDLGVVGLKNWFLAEFQLVERYLHEFSANYGLPWHFMMLPDLFWQKNWISYLEFIRLTTFLDSYSIFLSWQLNFLSKTVFFLPKAAFSHPKLLFSRQNGIYLPKTYSSYRKLIFSTQNCFFLSKIDFSIENSNRKILPGRETQNRWLLPQTGKFPLFRKNNPFFHRIPVKSFLDTFHGVHSILAKPIHSRIHR